MTITEQTKFPETLQQVKEYFMSRGFKMIPLGPATKAPVKGFRYELLDDPDYDFPLDGDENIGMAHGPASGTFAIDIDFKQKDHNVNDAIKILFNDIEKTLNNTLVIKTPKQGVHFIFKLDGDIFPQQKKYYSKQYPAVEIDIRSHNGLTVFPPSVHPEKKYGRYSFISNTLTPATMRWSNVELILAQRGFFTKDEIDNHAAYNDYDISYLLTGGFKRGERRKSENSLYCKLRIRGKTQTEVNDTIIRINRKLDEPLEEKELQYNLKYAELFYQNTIIPSQAEKKPKSSKEKVGHYVLASQLMDEYKFITHISGEIYYYSAGIYHTHGKELIQKKCRQYWESVGIETKHISEIINIIHDKTIVLSEDQNEDIFDTDYKKIILKNGMFEFDEMKFLEHDQNVLATTKHPIFYDESKKCPKFDKFLKSCFAGDEKRITQVLEMMALCFIKKYIIQKGYVNYGIGSNGKSTLLSILRNMLGIKGICSIPMQQFQKSQFIGYELRAKSANISADGGTEPIMKTGFIKEVLGGDAVRCEEKFKSPFIFIPFCTLIFTFNELPMVNDSSDGFARKIQTIHWDQRFYGKDRDFEVDKLAYDSDERSGIFNKLVPIIKRLVDDRKLQSENTVEETKAVWLSRSDSFFKFKNEKIVMGDYKITVDKIKESYKKFCEENGMTAVNDRQLYNKLSELINGGKPTPTRLKGESVRLWNGFTIDSELRDETQAEL